MDVFAAIRDGLGTAVPFVHHANVNVREVGLGSATATLTASPEVLNHLGTLHAGALFTLGETASGAALAGGLAPRLAELRLIARTAEIAYLRPAKGEIVAVAQLADPKGLLPRVAAEGRVEVAVQVSLRDAAGTTVATMRVDWVVLGPRPSAELAAP